MTSTTQNVEVVKELDGWKGQACLVRRGEDYFIVSSVYALYTGFETLVFRCDSEGENVNYCDVAGGRGASREDAIAQLANGDEDDYDEDET